MGQVVRLSHAKYKYSSIADGLQRLLKDCLLNNPAFAAVDDEISARMLVKGFCRSW